MTNRDEIYEMLAAYLEDMFELSAEAITMDALLYEELDLDSIDAVELVIKLQDITGKKFQKSDFVSLRTVGDVVEKVHALVRE